MKRGLVLSLCALALGAFAQFAQAQSPTVDVSLNLRYDNPANPAAGGKFYVVAQSNAAFGIAGLSLHINNIDSTDVIFGVAANGNGYTATTRANINDTLADPGNSPYKTTTGGYVNLTYGQDLSLAKITDVGKSTVASGDPNFRGNQPTDPLRNADWNNSTLLFSGRFLGTRPEFRPGINPGDSQGLPYNVANVFVDAAGTGQPVLATVNLSVRGDSLALFELNAPANAGLQLGDANRDFSVTIGDVQALLPNFNQPGVKTWDQGDFNADGAVTIADVQSILPRFNQPGGIGVAPQVAAIPEPSALVLAGVCGLAAFAIRHRKSQ